jgi:hypothetical protein
VAIPVVLFLVGPPGAGKTAAARALLHRVDPVGAFFMIPKPKWTVVPGDGVCPLALAGHYDGTTFEGADTVPYNGVAAALDWWGNRADFPTLVPALTIFDGDRFSNGPVRAFFEARAGVLTLCAHLSTEDPAETVRRREARSAVQQNASWVKGRETKAARFAEAFGARGSRFFTDGRTPTTVADELTSWAGKLAAS